MRLVNAIVSIPLVLLLSSCSAVCGPELQSGFHVDAYGPVVRDQETAVIIARAMWYSIRPDLEKMSEAEWLKSHTAHLENDAWWVRRSGFGLGGGVEIKIAKRDGKLLDIVFAQ